MQLPAVVSQYSPAPVQVQSPHLLLFPVSNYLVGHAASQVKEVVRNFKDDPLSQDVHFDVDSHSSQGATHLAQILLPESNSLVGQLVATQVPSVARNLFESEQAVQKVALVHAEQSPVHASQTGSAEISYNSQIDSVLLAPMIYN